MSQEEKDQEQEQQEQDDDDDDDDKDDDEEDHLQWIIYMLDKTFLFQDTSWIKMSYFKRRLSKTPYWEDMSQRLIKMCLRLCLVLKHILEDMMPRFTLTFWNSEWEPQHMLQIS